MKQVLLSVGLRSRHRLVEAQTPWLFTHASDVSQHHQPAAKGQEAAAGTARVAENALPQPNEIWALGVLREYVVGWASVPKLEYCG